MTIKRDGPHPLWLHLNGGAAMIAAATEDDKMFVTSAGMLQSAMEGVQAYHNSDIEPFCREMECIYEIHGTRVLKPRGWTGDHHCLLVPSLINSWRIFDIENNHSFIKYLNDSALCPLVIEWAQCVESSISLEDYIIHHLKPICDNVKPQSLMGYCMGGTMIAALYKLVPDLEIGKAVLIAPPWDFDYQTPDQRARIQSLALQTHMMGTNAPRDFIQSLFWAVDPLQVFKKFQKFPDVANPERFVRVEDWLNEGRQVSTSVIQTCLFDWYRDNAIVNGKWVIHDTVIDDQYLPEQTLVIGGENDHLVPMPSLEPLVKNRKVITAKTGHIGLMVSDKSMESIWKPIVKFLN